MGKKSMRESKKDGAKMKRMHIEIEAKKQDKTLSSSRRVILDSVYEGKGEGRKYGFLCLCRR
jgi:hypothetical protein